MALAIGDVGIEGVLVVEGVETRVADEGLMLVIGSAPY